ncbi:hypothetical protein H4S02_005152 [Coemansia sp. RSA 2611]|nr:hypothetical protein H4S02_005152 [Coemansia sp. RSA 2611]
MRQSGSGRRRARSMPELRAAIDPDDPDTQRIAAAFGFTRDDLGRLIWLSRSNTRIPPAFRRGWTPARTASAIDALPTSAHQRFLHQLLRLITVD